MGPLTTGACAGTESGAGMRFSKYISFAVLPIRRHAFFEQTVLQGQIGDHLLERRGLTPKIVTSSEVAARAVSPASQPLLASLQESSDQR